MAPRKGTTSSGAKTTDTQPVVALQTPTPSIQSTTQASTKDRHVTDTILQFSEDIASAEKPPLLPANEYDAEIRGAEVKESAKGNKYVAVTLVISPDNYPVDFDPANAPDGKTLSYNRLSAEDDMRSRYNMRKFCTAIGATMSKEIDLSDWIGLTAKVSVKHTEFEGESREEIGKVGSAE